ncbi:hypothetical protein [Actinomadura parmotrematis]|uniref:Uncharacterized protein n=1 Tax=Actinomadura parmotrematis TaxID=2864039 RepID=A0ABS7FNW6_9ACTN|nr:hypothetical protein [Actinomadura parmotrematis]MBW8482068.1 hypothetical protein [Actinomadura parmotrematis]
MGADSWVHIVPYQEDATAALAALVRKEMQEVVNVWPADGPCPTTSQEFWRSCEELDFWLDGILGLGAESVEKDDHDARFKVRLITDHEVLSFFGTAHPGRADFDRAEKAASTAAHLNGSYGSPGPCPPGCPHAFDPPERDSGRATVLYDDERRPLHIAFWGSTTC